MPIHIPRAVKWIIGIPFAFIIAAALVFVVLNAVKSDMTRAEADKIIAGGSISINGAKATLGAIIKWDDKVEGLRTNNK